MTTNNTLNAAATTRKPRAANTTRKPRAAKPEDISTEEQNNDEPTRDDVFAAALWTARYTNRVPTLLGPTASGKTFGVGELAKAHNAELITVLLGQHTPDEIAGFQLAINDKLVVQMPYWFRHAQEALDSGKSVYILFDELGLSREETRGALYTFFRDRHLHGHTLNAKPGQEVLVFAATNPGVFAPPFRSRCLFLPVPADKAYLINMTLPQSMARKVANLAPITSKDDPAYSNDPPPSPITVDASAIAALNAINTDFWNMTEQARMLVLAGLVPPQTLSQILKDSALDASALAKQPEQLAKALRALRDSGARDKMHGMINNVLESLPNVTPDERAEAILSIQDVIYDDDHANDLYTYFSTPRSEEVVKAVSEINPEYMEKRLKERGLMEVTTDAKGNSKITGTLVTRIQEMVKNTKDEA